MPIRIGCTFLDVGQISRCQVCIWFKVAQNYDGEKLKSHVYFCLMNNRICASVKAASVTDSIWDATILKNKNLKNVFS